MAGILPPLTALLKSPQDKVRKRAADAIGQLADGDDDIGNAVVATGWPVSLHQNICTQLGTQSFCLYDTAVDPLWISGRILSPSSCPNVHYDAWHWACEDVCNILCVGVALVTLQPQDMATSVGALLDLEDMLRSPQTNVQEAAAVALRKLPYAHSASHGKCACTLECCFASIVVKPKKRDVFLCTMLA